jgi:sec-independent protein translocase protein TatB
VKAEVNRSIELEELKKMKGQFEDAARDVEQQVSKEIHQTTSDLEKSWADADPLSPSYQNPHLDWSPVPVYKHPKKNWRLKRGAMPQWYKQRHGIRGKAQSGAARVARFRPPRTGS